MTPAYIKCVKEKFRSLQDTGELVQALINPTRAGIRDECLRIYPTRSGQKDKETLADFFGQKGRIDKILESIEKVDLEDLKALQNFFIGETKRPNYKVVEMMAWMIDFQPRPYSSAFDYSTLIAQNKNTEMGRGRIENQDSENKDENHKNVVSGTSATNGKGLQKNKEKPKRWKIAAITVGILLALGAGGYQIIESGKSAKGKSSNECMYWTGDHYEPISCLQREDTLVIPAEPKLLANFRRILNTDTVTEFSIGKLWYRKKNNKLELYTYKGFHPVDVKIKLKVLNEYMYNKYLGNRLGKNQ